jgi:hypothetical protein
LKTIEHYFIVEWEIFDYHGLKPIWGTLKDDKQIDHEYDEVIFYKHKEIWENLMVCMAKCDVTELKNYIKSI